VTVTGSLYDVLGVAPGASVPELRAAYLRAARRHHPDTGGEGADMTRLNEAWSVLSDPVRRRVYDRELGVAGGGEPIWSAGPAGPEDPDDSRLPFDADPSDLIDARPLSPPSARGVLPFIPPALFLLSIAAGSTGLVLGAPGVIGAAFGIFLLSCVAIAAVALLTLRSSIRHR
jgi:curved DNA-binding protein CbpA